jgi:1,6-anhydro-N-acetylmuramate kinase
MVWSERGDQAMSEHAMRRAVGVISGTSMDGIDVSMVETDGDNRVDRKSTRLNSSHNR